MSNKAINLAKQGVRVIIELAIITKKKQLKKYFAKPKTNEECFNYRKKDHYARDYYISNKKKLKKLLEEVKYAR